jgi:hypothetical protein
LHVDLCDVVEHIARHERALESLADVRINERVGEGCEYLTSRCGRLP